MNLQQLISTTALLLAAAVTFAQQPSPAAAPADRASAQGSLDNLTARDHDALKALVDSTTDPAVKARLSEQLEKLEDRMAYDPPPISFELKQATLRQVTAAFEKATGEKFPDHGGFLTATFTLSAKERPFWEVIRALNEQHPLSYLPNFANMNTLLLTSGPPGGSANSSPTTSPRSIVGGVAFFAETYMQKPPARGDRGHPVAPPGLSLRYSAMADPRIKVIRSAPSPTLRILTMRDDAGNDLLVPQANGQPQIEPKALDGPTLGNFVVIPRNFAKPGKKIAVVQGELKMVVQTGSETLDVANPEKNLNKPFAVGGNTIVITQFGMQGNDLIVRLNRTIEPQNPVPKLHMMLSISNGTGHTFIDTALITDLNIRQWGAGLIPPYKLHFVAPSKTREVTIPFEIKDIPLP